MCQYANVPIGCAICHMAIDKLAATLTAAGIISFPVALCLVIGANLGSGLLAII